MQVLYVIAKLGIGDILATGPKTAEELTAATGRHVTACCPESLTRIVIQCAFSCPSTSAYCPQSVSHSFNSRLLSTTGRGL